MRLLLWTLFWFIYFPLLRLLALLLFWNKKVENRERFEKKNKFERLAQSFHEQKIKADLCFEFSSEGEFQQVMPLIEDSLFLGKKIELVFFSPSVEKSVMKLAADYPYQIRYLRFPFLRLFPFILRRSFTHWVTASTVVMVRYDLFPELLLWSMKKENNLKFIWVSFKKDRLKGRGISWWKKLFLKNAQVIIYSAEDDKKAGEELGFRGEFFDFRVEQIRRRLQKRNEKLKTHFPQYEALKSVLKEKKKSVILGNSWPSDLFLLKDLSQEIFIVLVPHLLSEDNLSNFREQLSKMGRLFTEINDENHVTDFSSTLLINKKGILCELYADFTHAYVGGGFEGSIHSVLEPFIGGSLFISCGPNHHRSTEYDLALQAEVITEIKTQEQFKDWLNKSSEHATMNNLMLNYLEMREKVISC